MPILKVGGKIVRVGGKLVKWPTGQKWYAVRMQNYPEGEMMGYDFIVEEYVSAVTNPNMPYTDWSSQEAIEAAYGTWSYARILPGISTEFPVSVVTHGQAYKDRVRNYLRTPGPNTIIEFDSRAAAIAAGVAAWGLPTIPNRFDSAGGSWNPVSGYSNPVTPWVRHMHKLTTTNWEWWSDNSMGYANEDVSLICVNEPQDGWSQSTSSQGSYDMNLGDEENPNWITVYYGTRYCYEYLGLMSFSDGVSEAGASLETLQSVYPLNGMNFLPAFGCGISVNYYNISGQLEMTCPTTDGHLVLTGQFQFIDSRGCALAPIQECPAEIPAAEIAYVIYDIAGNIVTSGSALRTGWTFAIHLSPALKSSIHSIKLTFTIDESDRTFNSFTYKVNSVKINNTATPKIDGTYDYSMLVSGGGSLGTIEIQRRYIVK